MNNYLMVLYWVSVEKSRQITLYTGIPGSWTEQNPASNILPRDRKHIWTVQMLKHRNCHNGQSQIEHYWGNSDGTSSKSDIHKKKILDEAILQNAMMTSSWINIFYTFLLKIYISCYTMYYVDLSCFYIKC